MREILFRGKRIDNGEWVEGYYGIKGKGTDIENHYIMVPTFQSSIGNYDYMCYFTDVHIDSETLCQYTGMKDKNGNRIWENDILHRAYHSEEDCIVVWDDGRFNFKTIHGQYSQDPMTLLSLCFTQISAKRLKVIGNVFDTPELLKGE